MEKKFNNYLKFLISLAVMGFGISLVTKASLGTSAVSSVPYVLSHIFPYSFGMFTFIVNMVYFLIQLIVLNKDFPKPQYFQLLVGPILGFFIDLSMYALVSLDLNNYLLKIVILLIGCFIIAYSIVLQLEADVVINPTEGIVKLISDKTKIKFSMMKTYFDIFLVVVSVILSYVFLHKIVGVREGTLISAFVVGYFIKFINFLKRRKKMLNSLIVMDKTFVDKVYAEDVVVEIKKLSNLVSEPLSRDELLDNLDLLKDIDVIFSGWGAPEINAQFIKHAPNLKIVFYAAGTIKKVVTDAFWENNLRITTANTANAIPVAEFTLASIIFGLKNALALRNEISNTRVYPSPTEKNIYGGFKAKVGLISLGAIAKYTLNLMKPFDYDVYAYDPFISTEEAKALNVKLVDLDSIFSECDVVSLHTPLLDVTRGMIKKEHFLKMKNHSTFINTARGAVVDEAGMIEALKARPDISAYLDVVYPEPPHKDNELYDLENVFLTPHIAGSEGNEVGRMGSLMLEEFKLYLNDQDLNYEVSQAAFEVMA